MSPRTVAVAPFRNVGSDEYAHIGKALESMLIDNLSLLPGVLVLDREHVNILIEQAGLSSSEVGEDAATRAGTLLTAGSHADWSPAHLRLEAVLVDVDTGATISSASAEALATEFYKLVPDVAEGFASALAQPVDTLPSDVRQKIENPHTKSIKAVLLYGEALDALDRNDVDAARKACKALEKEDADFLLAKSKCTSISAVEPMALGAAAGAAGAAGSAASNVSEELSKEATEPSSHKKPALLWVVALLLIGGGAGGGYALSRGGGSGVPPPANPPPPGSPSPANLPPPPGGNNPPTLQGVGDRSVRAGDTAAIDMQCSDSDSTTTSIQNTSAGPNSSFNQTSGNPANGRYRQSTNANQAGQVFNVAFVCTDSGNPPASDTKTARISVLTRLTPTASPLPTATRVRTPTRTPTPTPARTPTRTPTAGPSS